MQLFKVLKYAPPPPGHSSPKSTAEFPITVQLLSVPPNAPPPSCATLPLKTQLLSVHSCTPPPLNGVQLVVTVQLLKVQANAPPPMTRAQLPLKAQWSNLH